jgi:hypothetical protein
VGGAFVLPWLKAKLGADGMVAAGSVGTAVAMVLFALARESTTALVASLTCPGSRRSPALTSRPKSPSPNGCAAAVRCS